MMWSELARIALLGLDRAKITDDLLRQIEQLGIEVSENDATTILLETAAALSQHQKVFSLPSFEGQLPKAARKSPIPEQFITPAAAACFQEAVAQFPKCLNEFSLLAQAQEQLLSPELLPIALEVVKEEIRYWNAIAPLIGERGWWLVGQRERWHFLKKKPYRAVEISKRRINEANVFVQQVFQQPTNTFLDEYSLRKLFESAYLLDISFYKQQVLGEFSSTRERPHYQLAAFYKIVAFREQMIKAFQ